MRRVDTTFDAMGCEVRLIVEGAGRGASSPLAAAADAENYIANFESTLSRFIEGSELCRLNADCRETVPVSDLMGKAVAAGLWAAQRTGGLVDPTLLHSLEEVGYRRSRAGLAPAPLADAILLAPTRRPACPHPSATWREFEVDAEAGTVRRPVGAAFETGGSGKGLAADMLAKRLEGHSRFVVDCGGDIRVGVRDGAEPIDVEVENPLTGERAHVLTLRSGGVATSGLNVRLWRRADGGFAHHLLDPSNGEPAWTGLIGATALGPTALEAETYAKAALLAGPEAGREFLYEHGGLLVHDDGDVELVGPLRIRPRVTVTVPRELLERSAA